MKLFTIKQLEDLSGIKAHTIRIWEQRYALVCPQRNGLNARLYTLEELERLLLVTVLNRNGVRISIIAKLPKEVLLRQLDELRTEEALKHKLLHRLIMALYRLDTERFTNTLCAAVLAWGTDDVMATIILPFAERTGLLWKTDCSPEEQVVLPIISQKISTALQDLPAAHKNSTVILFLCGGYRHDFMLLVQQYMLRKQGYHVICIGTASSHTHLQSIIENCQPDFLFTCLNIKPGARLHKMITNITLNHPCIPLLVVNGYSEQRTKEYEHVSFIKNLSYTSREMALSASIP
jgi:DNA-binding transcriptional MerR regulator